MTVSRSTAKANPEKVIKIESHFKSRRQNSQNQGISGINYICLPAPVKPAKMAIPSPVRMSNVQVVSLFLVEPETGYRMSSRMVSVAIGGVITMEYSGITGTTI
jgi:hypothetical protein